MYDLLVALILCDLFCPDLVPLPDNIHTLGITIRKKIKWFYFLAAGFAHAAGAAVAGAAPGFAHAAGTASAAAALTSSGSSLNATVVSTG